MIYNCYQCKTQLSVETQNQAAYQSTLYARCPKCNSVSKINRVINESAEPSKKIASPPPFRAHIQTQNIPLSIHPSAAGLKRSSHKNKYWVAFVSAAALGVLLYKWTSKPISPKKTFVFTQKNTSSDAFGFEAVK